MSAHLADVLDSENMFAVTAALPDQLESAAAATAGLDFALEERPASIALVGMGGSAVAGELLCALAAPTLEVPVLLVNSYDLPAAVTRDSLVLVSSFSGDTEETLAATRTALARGARVVTISSGGELGSLAREHGLLHCALPTDIPEPRAALGAGLGPLLVLFDKAGLLPGASLLLHGALHQLRARREELTAPAGGVAGELARHIDRRFPYMFAAAGIGAVCARRWKTQVNENAKQPAFFSVQPEACHNEVVGYGQSGDVTRQVFTMVELRSDYEHPRVSARFSLVQDALREVMGDVFEVRAKGENALAQALDLIMIGDFVSLHLATKEGIDPGPVPLLGEIKAALRRLS